jgi:quinoprotein glucose dehydrogenase
LHKGAARRSRSREHPELAAKGLRDTGSWNYGGPIVISGGVVFISETNYDKCKKDADAGIYIRQWSLHE